MSRDKILEPGTIVVHFKRETLTGEDLKSSKYIYMVLGVVESTVDGSDVVIYKALQPNEDGIKKNYARPLDEFMSEVDKVKYPDIKEKYRFRELEIGNTSFI